MFGFRLGKVVNGVEQYSNNIKHLVVIIVEEDNFVRGQELRAEAYLFLRFDLASRLYREIIGHSRLSPIMMLIDDHAFIATDTLPEVRTEIKRENRLRHWYL